MLRDREVKKLTIILISLAFLLFVAYKIGTAGCEFADNIFYFAFGFTLIMNIFVLKLNKERRMKCKM